MASAKGSTKGKAKSSSPGKEFLFPPLRKAWKQGVFLKLADLDQLRILHTISTGEPGPDEEVVKMVRFAWNNGAFLNDDYQSQRSILEVLVRDGLDKRQIQL